MAEEESKKSIDEVLSAISGLPRKEILEILDDVKQNHVRLSRCPGPHDFVKFKEGAGKRHEKCTKCGGITSEVNASWYRRGLEHGNKT